MTTDITELAQSLKAAAEKATPGEWERGDGEHGGELLVYCNDALGSAVCEATSEYNSIPKYQRIDNLDFIALANPANILALVEALEKAQAKIIELQQKCEIDPRTHEIIDLKERIENLESFRTAYMEWGEKTDWMQTDKRFDAMKPWGKHRADVLKEYIAELESRTVTSVTYSENADADYCRKWAWEQVKGEVETEGWTTGDNITYFGFFCWGWDMRRQYNEQRTVTVKLPEPFKLAKSSSTLTYYYADELNEALTRQGIKWEAE